MIISNVRSRTKYTYIKVKDIGVKISNILNEMHVPETFIKNVEVAEKVDVKFSKPVNQQETTLYVYVGGWRLVTQDRDKKSINAETNMYGVSINTSSDLVLYAPSKNASYLVKTPEGDIIAELIEGKLLNILFNILELEPNTRRNTLRNILVDLITNHYNYSLDKLKEESEEQGRRDVIDFLTKLASRDADEAEREVTRIERRIQDYESTVINLINERKMAMAKAEGLRIQSMKGAEGLNEELQKLSNINNIKGISIDGSNQQLIIHTEDIYINNAGKRYYIGEFDIKIDPRQSRVKFININNRRRSYWGPKCHHPHVDQDGSPCWGNVGTAVRNYIQQNEFQALASLLIGYLESVNTSDAAGKNITSWDVVNKAGQVVQEGYYYADPPANSDVYICSECQDTFGRQDISMSRGDVHICRNCSDKYFICPDCGDVCELEDAEQCERCGNHICEDCHEDSNTCNSCIEAEKLAAQLSEPGAVLCRFCNTVINESEVYTCESCGAEGCGDCITFDGRYACPNHR